MPENSKGQCIVVDKNGNPWGPFDDAGTAARWAAEKWPDQEQDENRTGKGWDISALFAPVGRG